MRFLPLVLFPLFLFTINFHMPQDFYYDPWAVYCGFMAVAFCLGWVMPNFGAPVALLLLYTFVNWLYVWQVKENRYVVLGPYDQIAIRYFAADSVAKILLICIPIMCWFRRDPDSAREDAGILAAVFCAVGAAYVLYQFAVHTDHCAAPNSCGGFTGNESMHAGMLCVTLPFVIKYFARRIAQIVTFMVVLTIFITKSRVGVGLLSAEVALWLVFSGRRRLLLGSLLPLAVGYLLLPKSLLETNGRWFTWKYAMRHWANNSDFYPFGTGLGSFHPIFLNIQNYFEGVAYSHWRWLHNDWLQTLFELGAVGLVLSLIVYLDALWRSRRDKFILTSLTLLGILMTMNYPLHSPAGCLFTAWIICCACFRV